MISRDVDGAPFVRTSRRNANVVRVKKVGSARALMYAGTCSVSGSLETAVKENKPRFHDVTLDIWRHLTPLTRVLLSTKVPLMGRVSSSDDV